MQLFANNIETTLASGLSSSATSMSVASSVGMPDPSGNEYFLVTICARSQNVESEVEIVKCIARAGTTLTIERAQEGTTGIAHDSGDIVSLRLTGGTLERGFPTDLAIGRINNPLLYIPLKNSIDMVCGAGSVTFARAGTSTYIDRYGVVQTAGTDVARFEKDGLLMEGASTNKCLQSEDLDTTWTKIRCTISANAIDAPDENATADGIIGTAVDDTHYVSQVITTTATKVTLSSFAKKGDLDWAELRVQFRDSTPTTISAAKVWYNLATGVVGTELPGTDISIDSKIIECADGWYRCIISATYTGSTSVSNVMAYLMPANGDVDTVFTGDGSTVNSYFWGAQLEEMPFATSYIPATTAAVSRSADDFHISCAENIPVTTNEATFLIDVKSLGVDDSVSQYVWYIDPSNGMMLHQSSNNNTWVKLGGSTYVVSSDLAGGTSYCLGVVGDGTNVMFYVDGSKVASDVVGTSPASSSSSIYLGKTPIGSWLYGHISNFRIFDRALSEQEIRIA